MKKTDLEPHLESELEEHYRRLAKNLFRGGAIAFLTFGLGYLLMLGSLFLFFESLLVSFLLWVCSYQVIGTKRMANWVHVGLFFTALFVALISISLGAAQSPLKYWYTAVIVSAIFLLDIVSVVVWIFITVLFFTSSMHIFSSLDFPRYPLTSNQFLILEISTYLGICSISAYFLYSYNLFVSSTLKEMREQRSDLKKLIRTLGHDVANLVFSASLSIGLMERKGEIQNHSQFSVIKSSLQMITELIDKVRSAEALKAGKIKVVLEEVCPNEIVKKLDTIFAGKIAEKGLKFKVSNNLPPRRKLYLDQTIFLHEILGNLLSNAIKFSNSGDLIELSFNYDERDQMALVTIIDRGIGIPEEMLEKIFSFHEKTARTGTNNERGTGFGMPLVKLYVDRLGGSLKVESRDIAKYPDQHGTTFFLKFPTAKEQN